MVETRSNTEIHAGIKPVDQKPSKAPVPIIAVAIIDIVVMVILFILIATMDLPVFYAFIAVAVMGLITVVIVLPYIIKAQKKQMENDDEMEPF